MTKIQTKEGAEFYLDQVSRVNLLETKIDPVNPLWIVLWLFVFFPMAFALIIASFLNKKYTCSVTVSGNTQIFNFDKANYLVLNLYNKH